MAGVTGKDVGLSWAINALIGLICFLVFCIFRARTWARKFYAPKEYIAEADLAPYERPPRLVSSFFGWIPELYSRPADDVIRAGGVDGYVYLRYASFGVKLFAGVAAWCLLTCLTTNLTGGYVTELQRAQDDPKTSKYVYWAPPPPPPGVKDKNKTKGIETPDFYVSDSQLPPAPAGLKWWKYKDDVPDLPDPATELGPEYAKYGWQYDRTYTQTGYKLADISKATMANVPPKAPQLWVHALTTLAVTAYTLWLLWRYSKDAVALRLKYLTSTPRGAETHSVLVTDVPGVRGGTVAAVLDRTALAVLPEKSRQGVHSAIKRAASGVEEVGSKATSLAVNVANTATRGAVRGLGSVGARPSEHKCLEKDPWAKAAAKTEGGMTATQLVASEFDELYPGEVASVQAVYDDSAIAGPFAQYEKTERALEDLIDGYAAQSRLGKTIKPKKVSVFGPALGKWGIEHYGKGTAKVDAVDFYLARLDHLKSVILQGQKEAIAKPEPSAFVTFKKRRSQVLATQALQHHDTSTWQTYAAPEPQSVYWPSLRMRGWERAGRSIIANVSFMLMTLLFMIPVAAVQSLISADSLGKIPGLESILKAPIVSGVIIGILPSLALIIFIALVPPILRLMSCFQGLHSEGDIDRACIAKFFIFQVVTIFFGSFVAGSFFNQAKAYVEDPKGAIKSIGLAAPQASTFFLTYVGIKTFFQPAFKHLRIIPFIIYSLRTKLAASDRVKNRLFSNEFPKYNVEVPYMSLIALLGLVFCAINPIMPPLCLVYFAVMYFFIKYQILHVTRPKYNAGGQMWGQIFKQIIAGLVIFQIVMGGFLLVQRSAGAAIPLILIPLTLAISRGLSSVFQKPLDVMSVRAAVDMDAADAAGVQFARAPSMAPRAGEAPSSLYQAPCFRFTGDSLDDLRIEAAQAKQYAEGTAKAPPLADDAAIEAVREEVASKERAVRRQATLAKRQPRTAGPSTTV